MVLQEAIIHARETAGRCGDGSMCAREHGQLADWLEELQQYKSTGLEPEEIREVQEAMAPIPFSRFHDIMEAERDSRLLVLPCNVGNTVWAYYLESQPEEGIVPYQITKFIVMQKEDGTLIRKYRALLLVGGKTRNWNLDFDFDELGKTVFLTREEAEAALRKEGAKCD